MEVQAEQGLSDWEIEKSVQQAEEYYREQEEYYGKFGGP
jgi:hypothetical protein